MEKRPLHSRTSCVMPACRFRLAKTYQTSKTVRRENRTARPKRGGRQLVSVTAHGLRLRYCDGRYGLYSTCGRHLVRRRRLDCLLSFPLWSPLPHRPSRRRRTRVFIRFSCILFSITNFTAYKNEAAYLSNLVFLFISLCF